MYHLSPDVFVFIIVFLELKKVDKILEFISHKKIKVDIKAKQSLTLLHEE